MEKKMENEMETGVIWGLYWGYSIFYDVSRLRSPSVLLGMEKSYSQYLYLAHDVLILRSRLAHTRMGPGHVTLLNADALIFQTAPFAGGVDAKDGYQHVFML